MTVSSAARRVQAARYPSVVYPSSISFSVGPTPGIWKKWSITAMYSNPASSAVRATVASSAPRRSGPRGVLKSGIRKPIFILNSPPPSPLSRPEAAAPPTGARSGRPSHPGPFGIMILTLPYSPVFNRKRRQPTRGRVPVTVRADLIIVGAGLAGAAAAYAAAGRGRNVVVLEAFGPAHRNGSSHGSARIFRRAYPDPLYVRLTGQAGRRWRALEAAAGESLLTLTGGIDFGGAREPERLHAVLTECGVPAELIPEQAAAERWPFIDFHGVGQVMYHEDAGVLDPDRAIAAMLRLAAANGADVRFDTPVVALATAPGGHGAVVATEGEAFTAPVAVVAAGAWIAPLLGGLVELPALTVTQQQVSPSAPAKGRQAEPWPVFIGFDGTGYRYGLPGGRDGGVPGAVKIGEHVPGPATHPAGRDFPH